MAGLELFGPRLLWVAGIATLLLTGCRDETRQASPKPSPSARPADPGGSISRARDAEQRRAPEKLTHDLLSSREERVRIAAVRALARIGGPRELLLSSLADESAQVVRWAAFGLGRACAVREPELTAALVLRAATLLSNTNLLTAEALPALADALGRCATPEAERSLRAWLALDQPIAEAAALALGRIAAANGKLEDASFVALLEAANRSQNKLEAALYAFTRLAPPEGALRTHALESLTRTAQASNPQQSFAVRALGRLGEVGVRPLSIALDAGSSGPAIAAEIARELGRLGNSGQSALSEALVRRAVQRPSPNLTTSPGESDVFLAILEALTSRTQRTRATLERLARLVVPESARAARRAVELRCAAARLLAGSATENADLRACDPERDGPIGKLALLSVLDRGELRNLRGKRFRMLSSDPNPVVRKAALGILSAHREFPDTSELLARALLDDAPGVVATAAEFLSKHPDRASASVSRSNPTPSVTPSSVPIPALRPDPGVVAALTHALRAAETGSSIEVYASLLDATAALGVLSLNAELEKACRSDNPTLREHAERARKTLSHTAPPCERSAPAKPADELERLVTRPLQLLFETDAGELRLELEPDEAPVSVTRLRDLAESGFYVDVRSHRAIPGFVIQLGDPGGDGFGGARLPALRCELSPRPFEAGSVGMALSGRDTGNSQFFVTLGRFPHLDGEYTRVGRAGPGWERLRLGDRVQRVRIE